MTETGLLPDEPVPDLTAQVLRMVTELGELERATYADLVRSGATPADASHMATRAVAPMRWELARYIAAVRPPIASIRPADDSTKSVPPAASKSI